MAKRKEAFETYEEIALNIRTAIELLHWMQLIYGKAWLHHRLHKVIWELDKIRCKLEEDMFKDCPEQANLDAFYGDGAYTLDIRKHRDYIYSSFKAQNEGAEPQ